MPLANRLALVFHCDPLIMIAFATSSTTSERKTPHSLNFLLSHQARGRPQEAEREVRALLALMRANEASVRAAPGRFQHFLKDARLKLKILDPELGEKELIKSVAAEVANLHAMAEKDALKKHRGVA